MSRERSDEVYIEDILSATESAMRFVAGMTYEEFLEDEKTIFAVIRALEIVGEATKRISEELKTLHLSLPWRVMAGMRDKLAHDYFGVNLRIVWGTVKEDLPEITPQLRLILSQAQE